MSTSTHLLVAGVALIMAACTSQPATRESGTPAEPPAATHAEEVNAIHLSEDMARDLRITTAPIAGRAGALEATVLGTVVADEDRYAEVGPATAGQIVRVIAGINTAVQPGSVLAQLRSTELGRARAALITAQAHRDLAQQTLDRKRSLVIDRIVAAREVQEAEAEFRDAEAQARAAVAGLRALGVTDADDGGDSSLFSIRSPIAGRVIDRHIVLGQYVEPSTALFTIADLSQVWVVVQAFERDAVNVRPGSIAHVTFPALPGREFDGSVATVGRQVDPGSRTVPVRINLMNPQGALRPGMSASARVEVGNSDQSILTVPARALQHVGEAWLVFIPRGNREFEIRPVGRGRDLGNDVEIISGLAAGETVVVEGAFLLKAEAEKRNGGTDEHGH